MADGLGTALRGRHSPMDADDVRTAYRRQARTYDSFFGFVSRGARYRAIEAVNALEASNVLEVCVGTGLALPHYVPAKRITGIDLSHHMLTQARERVAEFGLRNIDALLEMDAQATSFATGSFDAAVAMFVASVVPDPHALVAELRRVVKPGGTIVFINHFARDRGPLWWAERAMAPASSLLGWHPDFRLGHLFTTADLARAKIISCGLLGLFRLVTLPN